MKNTILKTPKSWRKAEELLTVIESYPETVKAAKARDKLLKMAKEWEEAGKVEAALSLYQRLIQGQKYAEAVKKYKPMGVAPRPKGTPKELGISGIFTWPVEIFRTILTTIRGQADKELSEEEKDLEKELEEEIKQ